MINNYKGKIHVVYDGMWGSCGKGKFCGQLARDKKLDIKICVNNNAPNAGHTFVYNNGTKIVTRHLPIGMVNKDIPYLVIGESAVIDPAILKNEIKIYKHTLAGRKIYICDTAAVVTEEHKNYERENLKTGSTFKGSGAALVDKIMRKSTLAKGDPTLQELERKGLVKFVSSKTFFPCVYNCLAGFKGDENILVECSQGDALSINSPNYPHTTSRDCNPAQAIKDIHATDFSNNVKKYCVFRPYPIRINNNSEKGYIYTGGFEGAPELEWKDVAERCGMPEELIKQIEQTTVTHRLRRVSEFCVKQFAEMLLDTRPDECYLNFAEYVNAGIEGITNKDVARIQDSFMNDYGRLRDEEYFENAEKNFALEHVLGYIKSMEEFFNGFFNDEFLNITQIGTGAKEIQCVNRSKMRQVSDVDYAINAVNPLDYADLLNLPEFDNVI